MSDNKSRPEEPGEIIATGESTPQSPVSGTESEMEIPNELPLLPVRDIVVFNYMILPLFVGREKSIQAIDQALNNNRYLLICTQKDEQTENPGPDDLYHTGTVVMIMRMLKMPDGRLKVLVQGISRARIRSFVQTDPLDVVEIEVVKDKEFTEPTSESEALLRAAREQSEKLLSLRGVDSSEIMAVLNSVDDPGRLADLVASNLRMKTLEAQQILESEDPLQRLRMVNDQLAKEVEVASMQAKIQNMAKEGMDKAQREYFLREQLKAIRKELGDITENGDDLEQLRQSLKKAGLPAKVMKEAEKQLQRLESMHPDSAESTVARTYLDWLVEIPWKKRTKDRLDIQEAQKILDEDHFNLEKVKERILEYLSVRKLNPRMKGPILCFVGPPGVGKTSLGQSIARSLNRKFVRMSLGGMRDEAEIRGHRRTYIGSMPGRIIQSMKDAGSVNPVFMLDEIDKVGTDFRGDPSSALLEVLDPEQNHSFTDHYLNVPYDLSRVMFVCTANILDTIPSALLDRMEVLRIPGYTEQEKVKIARKYLVPRQINESGLEEKNVLISDGVLKEMIRSYTREAGLRNLEREIAGICRKVARQVAERKKGPFKITKQKLVRLLGPPRFRLEDRDKELPPGVAIGLAWTAYGGEILHVEVSLMPGKGKLILTGQMGEVMKESAQASLSYARSRARTLGLMEDLLDKRDIHIHVPAGATPKDGPSAGLTMVSALVSALSDKVLPNNMGMTGEITLRGRVLPVGGIKEKILAAVASGIKTVIIPEDNKRDFEDIPPELRKNIQVKTVENIDQIWPLLEIGQT